MSKSVNWTCPRYKLLNYGDFGFRQAIGLAHQMGKIDCSYKEFNDASIETLLLLLRQVDRVDEILTFSNEFQKKMPRLLVKKLLKSPISNYSIFLIISRYQPRRPLTAFYLLDRS